ncbi:hypothetical protein [Petroclostridium sp. X23]|uniref:hypothetical protein n=1 Tax=Petroclostridium sp. X23 TaxID=3045146 RepID=UPI0024AE017E|nr:hypothetical protein [Petroclostridium sp. X23]WHH59196.1 hypothetical protein QKW49_00040 [Petroclostridium sp. X23]
MSDQEPKNDVEISELINQLDLKFNDSQYLRRILKFLRDKDEIGNVYKEIENGLGHPVGSTCRKLKKINDSIDLDNLNKIGFKKRPLGRKDLIMFLLDKLKKL